MKKAGGRSLPSTPTLQHSSAPILRSVLIQFSRPGQRMPQVEIHDGGIKQQTVEQVEDATNAGEKLAGIFHAGFAFKEGFDQVAYDGGEAENHAEDDCMQSIHGRHLIFKDVCED